MEENNNQVITMSVKGQEIWRVDKTNKESQEELNQGFIKEQEEMMAEVKEHNEKISRIIQEQEKERQDGLKEMTESIEEHKKIAEEIKQETQEGLAEMQESLKSDTEETPIKNSIIITKIADNHFQVNEITTIKGDTTILMQELSKALLKLAE